MFERNSHHHQWWWDYGHLSAILFLDASFLLGTSTTSTCTTCILGSITSSTSISYIILDNSAEMIKFLGPSRGRASWGKDPLNPLRSEATPFHDEEEEIMSMEAWVKAFASTLHNTKLTGKLMSMILLPHDWEWKSGSMDDIQSSLYRTILGVSAYLYILLLIRSLPNNKLHFFYSLSMTCHHPRGP